MSEQADNMLESPIHHRLNHHGSNNGNLLLQQQEQQDEITQLTNNVQTNDNETTNDLNNINSTFEHNNTGATTSSAAATSTQSQSSTSSAVSNTAAMAALATANAIAVARAAAAAAAAAQAAMNSVSNSNSSTSTSTMNSSGMTTTHQQPHSTRRNASANNNSNLTNSIINNSTAANNVGLGNNDGNHLDIHRMLQKSKEYRQQHHQHHHHHHHHHNSSTRQNDENERISGMPVEDVIIGESGGGEDENEMIRHATSTQDATEEDEFQMQLHHHNMLVHENEIEIGNVVEHEAMQHHEEVIIGGAHPIVIKTEAGDHDLSGTVTLVSADGLQQQQLHHIAVSGRESNSGLNNGTGQDGGTRLQTSHGNIITIPMGSMPYTVISDSDPFKMNTESGIMMQSHSSPVDGCDGYCCQYKKSRDENGTHSSRMSTSMTQDPLQTTPPRSSSQSTSHSRLSNTTSTSSSSSSSLFCNSHLTWEEAVSAPILPVRCKDTNAELYKNKFGSGNKGKCIKSGNDWFTPTEFEALCGRGNSKDWKRSIRFGGRTLQTLIDKGFLVPHASSCICSNCVDDATATGPIRPFTPYQRKRKSQSGDSPVKQTKLERLTSKDSNTDESSDVGTPGPSIAPGLNLNPLSQALMKVSQMNLPSSNEDAWKVLEEEVERVVTAAGTLKTLVQEMKERTTQENEELRSQLQNSLHTAVQSSVVGHPQILRIFDNNRIQTYSIEVLDPDSFSPMQENATTSTKCDNCGREGSLECSGCHAVHYCSSFCQKKDWPTHQAACQDRGNQLKEEVL